MTEQRTSALAETLLRAYGVEDEDAVLALPQGAAIGRTTSRARHPAAEAPSGMTPPVPDIPPASAAYGQLMRYMQDLASGRHYVRERDITYLFGRTASADGLAGCTQVLLMLYGRLAELDFRMSLLGTEAPGVHPYNPQEHALVIGALSVETALRSALRARKDT